MWRDSRSGGRARLPPVPADYTYRMRIEHRPGQLARAMEAIAEAGGLIGETRTRKLTPPFSVREPTAEADDGAAAEGIRARPPAVDTPEGGGLPPPPPPR